ncbi:MAG: YbjN domain-containing protein, partial [Verrucomicrobiales bacterium]
VWDQRQVLFRATNLFDQKQSFPQTILQSLVHAAVAEMDRLTPLLAEVHKNDPASVLLLDITRLLLREDWLPPVSIDEP